MKEPYAGGRLYGPYLRDDGRYHIIILFEDGSRKTVSYPRFVMETHLGRYLTDDETVDHIDVDINNDDIKNLRILMRSTHAKKDSWQLLPMSFVCPACHKVFILKGRPLQNALSNNKKKRTGPYCDRSCAGVGTHLNTPWSEITGVKYTQMNNDNK
jgi:hypothetical protein